MGTASGSGDDLQGFAREHHVSYEVDREPPAATQPAGSTFDVQLFASHGEDSLEAPLCPRCVELTRALHSFATQVVASAGAQPGAEILTPAPAIYAPKESRGPDEVSVVLRVVETGADEHAAAGTGLQRIEQRLKALGVSRR